MNATWDRFVNRFVPTGLLPRRRSTEAVLRGLYERYSGVPLQRELEKFHLDGKQIKIIFDVVDKKFGARIWSGDLQERGRAIDEACHFIANAFAAGIKHAE